MKIRDAARATARVIGRTLKGALRVLSLLFVILVLAAGAAAYYVSQRFSPEDARRLAAEQMTALLHREVVINRLVLSPHGIKMLGLRVRRGGSEPDFVACDSALVTIRLRPLFDRRLEIDAVRLESPQIALIRDERGHWDLSEILRSSGTARGGAAGFLPEALRSAQLLVTDGVLRVDDRERGRTLSLEGLSLSVESFAKDRPFPIRASFSSRATVGSRELAAKATAEGTVDLAGLAWSSAAAHIARFTAEIQGVPFTGDAEVRGFLAPRVEGSFSAPPLVGDQWTRLFAHEFPFSLPASRWRVQFSVPAPGLFDFTSARVRTADGTATATGVVDFAESNPSLSVEATFADVPLERAAAHYAPWAKRELAGKATLRVEIEGWPGRLQAREADLNLRGFGASWGDRRLDGVDLDVSATEEFSQIKATVAKGRATAYGHVFEDLSGSMTIDGRKLSIKPLVFKWEGSRVKLRAQTDRFFAVKGAKGIAAPKSVELSGTVDKIDWEAAAKLIADVRAALPKKAASAAGASDETDEPRPWLTTFKYSIPRGFPDTTGAVHVSQVTHPNFNCQDVTLLWFLRGITPELDKLNGEAYLRFGPGRIEDLEKAQEASRVLRVVFLPFIFMHKMNNLSVFSGATAYPKSFDFTKIDGEYGASHGVATIRYFSDDGPQFVAYTDGTVDLGGEKVDLNILTRLTSYRGTLPEWWVDEGGRPAIGFRVKGDIIKPELQPRFKKIADKEIETDVELGRARAKKRFLMLERRLNF